MGKLNYKGFRAIRCIRFHETCALCFNIIKAACSDGLVWAGLCYIIV
ncbi:hypothetical protein NEIFLAOT_01705 [Neisseria flavescens NRL30031/H210]|uniref:Uncharacterized protein n=1 Tax=Neisseria flavescens NRL30031/H210 TaxID=546264 RepID=C0EP15_NEIFL|nr:hypothetical protein NEIFLAOT_01705 [Neisseria flavescens NRL30031/H210]